MNHPDIDTCDPQALDKIFGVVQPPDTTVQIPEQLLINLRQQLSDQEAVSDRRSLGFILLFLFLYTLLGASLTVPIFPERFPHFNLSYAAEAIPVLLAFSGYFISILFLLFSRSAARRHHSLTATLRLLEKHQGCQLSLWLEQQNQRQGNYSQSAIRSTLALFITVTWVMLYNYFTFTTSGVIGSVISLFISTMLYVILDIQLLKDIVILPASAQSSDTE